MTDCLRFSVLGCDMSATGKCCFLSFLSGREEGRNSLASLEGSLLGRMLLLMGLL